MHAPDTAGLSVSIFHYICIKHPETLRPPMKYRIPAMAATALLSLLSSCKLTKTLEEGEYLLVRNKIEIAGDTKGIDTDEIYSILQPRPNKKFLGILPVKLTLYNWGSGGKESSRFRRWLREKVGERPNLYDSLRINASTADIVNYLAKTGFFNSDAAYRREQVGRKQKMKVIYVIHPSTPYKLRNIYYPIDDSLLRSFIVNDKGNSLLNTGDNYNAFKMEQERGRITDLLQQKGYFYFNPNFIYYQVDSAMNSHQMDLYVRAKDSWKGEADSLHIDEKIHKRYLIKDIYITPNYDPLAPPDQKKDTLDFEVSYHVKGGQPSVYRIIHSGSLKINPKTISQSVFMRQGSMYNALDVRKTRSRINELGLYSYTGIKFREVAPLDTARNTIGELDCIIDLSRRKLHSFTLEAEGTNSGGRPGIGFNFTYQNNNIFRGSEILRFKWHFALEAQKAIGSSSGENTSAQPLFNTVETGFEVSVDFPRFLVPIRQERFPKYFRPKTTVSISYGYEQRPEYRRTLTGFSFGYNWKESETKRHVIYPLDISIIDVVNSPEFQDQIDNEPNDRIRSQYTDHFILALRYSFIFNNQDIRKLKNFVYFRGTIEPAGNLLNLGYKTLSSQSDSLGYYRIFGIRYAQFIRTDVDFRYFNVITRNNTLAYRFAIGVGVPYGNSEVLPLEKGFYGGGANGMRGWPYRLLGPGSYDAPDSLNYDRMGDIQLELNLEYRFPIYKFLKAAIFTDIGNIWLLKENESYPGGKFDFDTFYNEVAVDAGLGIRLDFNFFILRVDVAAPMHDPAYPINQRWRISKLNFDDFLINFGIGYPF